MRGACWDDEGWAGKGGARCRPGSAACVPSTAPAGTDPPSVQLTHLALLAAADQRPGQRRPVLDRRQRAGDGAARQVGLRGQQTGAAGAARGCPGRGRPGTRRPAARPSSTPGRGLPARPLSRSSLAGCATPAGTCAPPGRSTRAGAGSPRRATTTRSPPPWPSRMAAASWRCLPTARRVRRRRSGDVRVQRAGPGAVPTGQPWGLCICLTTPLPSPAHPRRRRLPAQWRAGGDGAPPHAGGCVCGRCWLPTAVRCRAGQPPDVLPGGSSGLSSRPATYLPARPPPCCCPQMTRAAWASP